MRFHPLSIFFSLLALAGLTACEDDFDPNADYQEIAVIYSLIDSNHPVQYAKVTKAFLNTKSDAMYIAANNPDSSGFYHEIKVELQKLRPSDSTVQETYPMHPVTVTDKDPGNFYFPEQRVYATAPGVQPAANDLVRIMVTNLATGRQYSAATRVIGYYCVSQVGYNPHGCDPEPGLQLLNPESFMYIRMQLSQQAAIYKAVYHLRFREFHPGGNPAGELKTVSFIPINNQVIPFASVPGGSFEQRIDPDRIFEYMVSNIDISNDDADTYREMTEGEVVVTAGGFELDRYIQVNNAYSAITQARPEYSNIRNGTGLFSSRRVQRYRAAFSLGARTRLRDNYPDLKFKL